MPSSSHSVTPALVLAVVGLLAGCQVEPMGPTAGPRVTAPSGTISVYQLAGRLDMRVSDAAGCTATLTDGANCVVLFGRPNGQAFVNARPLDGSFDIVRSGEVLFVPRELAGRIRPLLRPDPKPAPARPAPRPAPPAAASRRRIGRVVIDPGHGGRDPGAIAADGPAEKTVNLAVARRVARRLAGAGVDVRMTRDDDRFIELNDRADFANRNGCDLFVSIHADSAPRTAAEGCTLYVARGADTDSVAAAELLERRMMTVVSNSRGVREANFRVLVRTTCPAVLIETGFLSNAREAALLADANYQKRLADAIALAIVDYLRP